MTYPLPTFPALVAKVNADYAQAYQARGITVRITPNMDEVTGRVLAQASLDWHSRAKWLSAQIFAHSADDVWLVRHAYEIGIKRRPPTSATGNISLATTTAGVVIPAGVTVRSSGGREYLTSASFITVNGTSTAPVRAITPGVSGNLDAGAIMTVDGAAYPALPDTATVDAGGIGGGADEETVESLRSRVLARKATPPLGGSRSDWVRWTTEVPGVAIRNGNPMVFVDRFTNDPRTVWVAVLFEGRVNGIPTPSDIAAVQAYLDDPVRRPVTANVVVLAPTPIAVNVTIDDLVPDTEAVRAVIRAELEALFLERVAVGMPSQPFTLSRSWIAEAVSRATGEDSHTLATPAADVVFASGEVPVLGTVSYT